MSTFAIAGRLCREAVLTLEIVVDVVDGDPVTRGVGDAGGTNRVVAHLGFYCDYKHASNKCSMVITREGKVGSIKHINQEEAAEGFSCFYNFSALSLSRCLLPLLLIFPRYSRTFSKLGESFFSSSSMINLAISDSSFFLVFSSFFC